MNSKLAYIARRPECGCICFASTPESMRDVRTANDVAKMLREGYSIERATVQAVRSGRWSCPKCQQEGGGELFAAQTPAAPPAAGRAKDGGQQT